MDKIQLDAELSQVQDDQVQDYSSNTVIQLTDQLDHAIDSTLLVSSPQLNYKIYANSVDGIEPFDANTRIGITIFANDIESEFAFGALQINQEIDDVPFPSIESTLVIPQPNVLKVIGPLGIGSTQNFGVASFIDNIHRILVFKDDNISKVGENDATVIAGGIRLNPASTASNTASAGSSQLPEAPVGFLSVNIAGIDYKIPYYNS